MTVVLNYTPHDPLRVYGADDDVVELPSAGEMVRLREVAERTGELRIGGRNIPVVTVDYGPPEGLPEPVAGTVLVVSQLVCRALPERADLVFPTDLVRNDSGDIVGCRAFARGTVPS